MLDVAVMAATNSMHLAAARPPRPGTPAARRRPPRRRTAHRPRSASGRRCRCRRCRPAAARAARRTRSRSVRKSASAWQGWCVVGERVDDRHVAERSASSTTVAWANVRMTIAGAEPRQHAGGVGDRLAAAELQLVGPQHERQHAQTCAGGRERHAGAGGRLLEEAGDHPRGAAVEERLTARPSSPRPGRAGAANCALVEIGDLQQVGRDGGVCRSGSWSYSCRGEGSTGSRTIGQDMQRGPPRPRPSSEPAMVMTSMPSWRRRVLVSTLRS